MRRVWGFLSDPSLHLLVIALVLIALSVGSAGPREPRDRLSLVSCSRCRAYHYMGPAGTCIDHTRIAQARP